MSLITGYSSESDEEKSLVISEKNKTDLNPITLPNLPSSYISSTKSNAAKIEKQIIDPLQFQRNKRSYELHNVSKIAEKTGKKIKTNSGNPEDIDGYKGSWASSDSSSNEIEGEGESTNDIISSKDATLTTKKINKTEFKETSRFHGKNESKFDLFELPNDYAVRFATTIVGQKEYFIPKKQKSVFKGHNSSISTIEFIPKTGHYLLSSGTDGMVKLWSVSKPKKLIRDYHNSNRALKYSKFSSDGSEFITCSFDKKVRIWDTESGKVKYKHDLKSNPNMCIFLPNNDNEFMVALDNNKIEHIDQRSGEIIQIYEHFENSVRWIDFINDGKQFITTSDDRSIKIWDTRINMPIKYIQDDKQKAIPIVKVHPNGQYFVGQSMDNQILTYSTKQSEKFKRNPRKVFTGHNCAAYAIQMGFTPDGKTLFSGDSTGKCFFWDWKTTKVKSQLKISNSVITCIDVHPLESSLYAMAGYDGNIYMYN